jgi:ribonucleoside-diphosphate reductase alpha chain
MGPRTQAAEAIHATKHRLPGETFREAGNRIASALCETDEHFKRFRDIYLNQRFVPGGRIQVAVGTTTFTTPYNCYVSGAIEDSFVDGDGCIMHRLWQAAATLRMGGGIGYDFSPLRPRNDCVRRINSHSTGPISFMGPFNEIGTATSSTGRRRGAQMGVLRVDHPDIEEFILAKQNGDKLTRFNLSIAVTDEFMECVASGKPFALRWGGRTYRHIDAGDLWERIMRSTWDWGEPGVLFIDRINRMNNLHYCETIAATNPCAEQPLPPFGACLLGSFNLVSYLRPRSILRSANEPAWDFDWDMFRSDIPHVVRAMDRVVDIALYPLPEQEQEAKSKRRMGLGVMGLANAGEALGYPYATPDFIYWQERILSVLSAGAYNSSVDLAKERGSFEKFDVRPYLKGGFAKKLPEKLRYNIAKYGIRNSHLISMAPTGTISQACDFVSSGIEPPFSVQYDRPIEMPPFGERETFTITDHSVAFLGVKKPRTAMDLTAQEHIDVLATAQKYTDSSVSKTVNVPSSMPWSAFKQLYQNAYEAGCKSLTTFQDRGKRMALLQAKSATPAAPDEACFINENGERTCAA